MFLSRSHSYTYTNTQTGKQKHTQTQAHTNTGTHSSHTHTHTNTRTHTHTNTGTHLVTFFFESDLYSKLVAHRLCLDCSFLFLINWEWHSGGKCFAKRKIDAKI